MTLANDLVDKYGPTIKTIAAQVAREYAAPFGRRGHGYEVVSADDIEQATYEQLLRSGTTVESLDSKESPEAYLRTTARLYGAANEAKARRRSVQSDLSGSEDDSEEGALGPAIVRDHPSTLGNPEEETLSEDLIAGARRIVETILRRVSSLNSREVARLFYLAGLDSPAIAARLKVQDAAVRKALQRARDEVGPEADASLRAWREFTHPGAKRPQATDARPTALIRMVSGRMT